MRVGLGLDDGYGCVAVVKLNDRAGREVSHAVYLRGGRIVDVGYGEVSFDSEDCASGASAPAAKLKEGCDPNAALEGLGKPAKWCPLKGEWLDVAPKNNSGKKRKKPE